MAREGIVRRLASIAFVSVEFVGGSGLSGEDNGLGESKSMSETDQKRRK